MTYRAMLTARTLMHVKQHLDPWRVKEGTDLRDETTDALDVVNAAIERVVDGGVDSDE